MVISLSKGSNLSLTKTAPTLKIARLGLGWDVRTTTGAAFDLDASALMLDVSGKVPNQGIGSFIFYGQLQSPEGAVIHTGDNLTGEGDGDDETLLVDLTKVPATIDRIVLSVSIHEADQRGQNFGQVRNAFIRLVNDETNEEIVRYDLSEDYSTETALNFAELYRNNGEWKFRAVGQGYATGLAGIATDFGVVLS